MMVFTQTYLHLCRMCWSRTQTAVHTRLYYACARSLIQKTESFIGQSRVLEKTYPSQYSYGRQLEHVFHKSNSASCLDIHGKPSVIRKCAIDQNHVHRQSSLLPSNYFLKKSGNKITQLPNCASTTFQAERGAGVLAIHKQAFHTSSRLSIPPVLWIFLKPVAKIGAILFGRGARKLWQTIPEDNQSKWRGVFYRFRYLFIIGFLVISTGSIYLIYLSHLQETPVTKRKRFLAFTTEQFMKIAQHEADKLLESYNGKYLPESHPLNQRVCRVTEALISHNQDFPQIRSHNWTVAVVDSDDRNAFVLPTGHVFVFTGLLKVIDNNDQLAVVLAHELAHVLLSHGAEQVSFAQVLDWMVIVVMAVLWAIMPTDGIALVSQWFNDKVVQLLLHMPYSRMLEREADRVGLDICAKACYDIREGAVFWSKMEILSQLENTEPPEWLSTHPAHDKRVEYLNFILPKALTLRDFCKCPSLPKEDPRIKIELYQSVAHNTIQAQKTGQNLSQVLRMDGDKLRSPG